MSFILGNEWLVMFLVGACVFAFVYTNAELIFKWLRDQSLGNKEYVIKKLDMMFVEVDQKRLTGAMLMVSFGMGALVFLLFWPEITIGLPVAIVVTYAGWQLPRRAVDVLYQRRAGQFVDQMVDGLTLMSNGVRSGLSIPQAMKLVVDNMPNPMAQEFELMLSKNALGVSLEEVMTELGTRIPLPDVQMFVTAINILKDTGGNVAETFDTIAMTVRERIKIEKKIAAITAQGVMQGIIITMVPFAIIGIFFAIDPNYIAPLFTRTLGWVMLIIMLGLQIIGGVMIRKIVKIKV